MWGVVRVKFIQNLTTKNVIKESVDEIPLYTGHATNFWKHLIKAGISTLTFLVFSLNSSAVYVPKEKKLTFQLFFTPFYVDSTPILHINDILNSEKKGIDDIIEVEYQKLTDTNSKKDLNLKMARKIVKYNHLIRTNYEKYHIFDCYGLEYERFRDIFMGLIATESSGREKIEGGLCQVKPEIARKMGINPDTTTGNIEGGVKLLSDIGSKTSYIEVGLQFYCSRKTTVEKAIELARSEDYWEFREYLPHKAKNYVPKVLAYAKLFREYLSHEQERIS